MSKLLRILGLAGLWLALGSATAGVTVSYTHPERFSDLPIAVADREQVFKELDAHFAKLAATLPPGVDMKVEVRDLDLAGRMHFTHRQIGEIRVLNGGADWPTMTLHYSLERDGKIIASGDEHLKNLAYLDRANRYASGDTLRYEKQMIDDWFHALAKVAVAAR